jgi:hypothetical protein
MNLSMPPRGPQFTIQQLTNALQTAQWNRDEHNNPLDYAPDAAMYAEDKTIVKTQGVTEIDGQRLAVTLWVCDGGASGPDGQISTTDGYDNISATFNPIGPYTYARPLDDAPHTIFYNAWDPTYRLDMVANAASASDVVPIGSLGLTFHESPMYDPRMTESQINNLAPFAERLASGIPLTPEEFIRYDDIGLERPLYGGSANEVGTPEQQALLAQLGNSLLRYNRNMPHQWDSVGQNSLKEKQRRELEREQVQTQ